MHFRPSLPHRKEMPCLRRLAQLVPHRPHYRLVHASCPKFVPIAGPLGVQVGSRSFGASLFNRASPTLMINEELGFDCRCSFMHWPLLMKKLNKTNMLDRKIFVAPMMDRTDLKESSIESMTWRGQTLAVSSLSPPPDRFQLGKGHSVTHTGAGCRLPLYKPWDDDRAPRCSVRLPSFGGSGRFNN